MILTGGAIQDGVANGHIVIEPFDLNQVNPNSYNYRLGDKLLVIDDEIIDSADKQNGRLITLWPEGFVLQPGKLYLGSTLEKIGSDHFVTSLIGRSSVGRLGLFMQVTADMGNIGAKHHWTLELKAVQPIRVYPGMKIGQVSFWKPEGTIRTRYQGKYHKDTGPMESRIAAELMSTRTAL